MSDWAAFRTAVEAAFRQALPSSLRSAIAVSWAGGARKFGGADGRVLLGVQSDVEEHVREADVNLSEVSSSNLITLQVTCESQHDAPTKSALRLAKLLQLGLRKESVYAILDAAGISLLEDPLSPQNVSYPDDGRTVGAYAFDVALRFVFELTPEADDAIGLLEHVEASAELELPEPPHLTYDVSVDDPTPEP
jgi:hypothetical protein